MRSSGWTITASPSASPSSTRTGLRSATHVQVLEGLAEGDAVIVQPDERIVDGTRIEAH